MMRRTAAAALAAAMLVTAGTAVPAVAGDDEKIRQGGCSGSADWKLKVKTDDGRLEVEAEVDSNVSGQTLALADLPQRQRLGPRPPDDRRAVRVLRRRAARCPNLAGTDTFRLRAAPQRPGVSRHDPLVTPILGRHAA